MLSTGVDGGPGDATRGKNYKRRDASSLIVTEGDFNAMAVYQATGLPAVSLPNGC